MPRSRIAISSVALGLLASGFVVACGSDDEKASGKAVGTTADASSDPIPPNIITDRDVQGQPEGGPGRVLLQWAQAIQFSDADGVADLSTADAISSLGGRTRLDKAVGLMGSAFARVSVVGVVDESSDAARVRATLSSFDAQGKRVQFTPTTFSLAKDGNGWKIADLALVSKTLRDYEALDSDPG